MDDNKELEKEQKQVELDQTSQQAAHLIGKGVSTYYGGKIGNQAYDLASQTKMGQDVEDALGKALQKNPIDKGLITALDKSGVLDATDKAIDMADGDFDSTAKDLEKVVDITLDNKSNDLNMSSDNNSEANSETSLFSIMGVQPNKMKKIIAAVLGFFILLLVIIIMIASSVLGPIENVKEFINRMWNGIVDFFTYFTLDGFFSDEDQEKLYYEKLYDVQKEFNSKYEICIDINLITASLTVGKTFDDSLSALDEKETNQQGNSYSKMKQYIEVLAKMQIKTKTYESTNECTNDSNLQKVLITEEGSKNSSSAQLVALNDARQGNVVSNFFDKLLDDENNFEYYKYYGLYENQKDEQGNIVYDTEGNPKTICNPGEPPADEYVLDIGTLDTYEDAVFYWNLVNSFIPDYYEDDLPTDKTEKDKRIKEIAEEIYLLYEEIGPSQTCGTYYNGPSTLCPNGITITGENAGVYDFEEYIAGVVSKEAYTSEGIEALKAQAVAARTYALKTTNYCQNSIENNTKKQTFTRDINDNARKATNATSGEILIDKDGKIFTSEYDSFCYNDSRCPDSTRNSDGTYSVTYTKIPYGETHKVTLSDSSQYGRITNGQGHARGMSQLVSYQLAKEGKNYKEILSYFYSEGVTISLVLSPNTTDGAEIIRGPIGNYVNINVFNDSIFNKVKTAGLSTREGVVAAATTLVSSFYNETGLKLPYELLPSGKYTGYGLDSSWGTNTGRSDYPLNGLDCSGFISWAIHNGGFAYDARNAQSWGNAGNKRAWSKGMTDSNAKPGDLIYNAPASNNGTSGHIRMIIGKTDNGYVVAEASSKKNGVRINNVSFKSTGNYYLVDMSGYYESATKVSDYPS